MMRIITRSAGETKTIAARFAKNLRGSSVIALFGPLGAGKTEFVKGIASGLGIKRKIKSPTFVFEKRYKFRRLSTSWLLRHFDLYRTSKPNDLVSLGLKLEKGKHTITIIEWPERAARLKLHPDYLVKISLGKSENERHLNFSKKYAGRRKH